jgi:superfamily II DNA or RNA helicase
VPSAHIDGETPATEREDIFGQLADGSLSLVSSCGVLREGWNFPAVYCGILLQVCGALSTYIQIAGRLMRAAPGKDSWLLIDHAGAFHRHGFPDEDRDWSLDDTDKSIAKEQRKALELGKKREPICCPACSYVRMSGPSCPACGHQHEKSCRNVRTVDGKLVKMHGQSVKVKQQKSPDEKAWTQALFQCANSGKTVAQASHLFHKQTNSWPSSSLPYVPEKGSNDWGRKVADVYPWTVRRKQRSS